MTSRGATVLLDSVSMPPRGGTTSDPDHPWEVAGNHCPPGDRPDPDGPDPDDLTQGTMITTGKIIFQGERSSMAVDAYRVHLLTAPEGHRDQRQVAELDVPPQGFRPPDSIRYDGRWFQRVDPMGGWYTYVLARNPRTEPYGIEGTATEYTAPTQSVSAGVTTLARR